MFAVIPPMKYTWTVKLPKAAAATAPWVRSQDYVRVTQYLGLSRYTEYWDWQTLHPPSSYQTTAVETVRRATRARHAVRSETSGYTTTMENREDGMSADRVLYTSKRERQPSCKREPYACEGSTRSRRASTYIRQGRIPVGVSILV